MVEPPTGTVTFLFTDIEGSTTRWEHQPELMQAAFRRHEAILRQSIAAHEGYAYKMIGDAFQVAFSTAPAALAASVDAQRALAAEAWGAIGPLRVRMALHTGAVEERGDDYVGPLLNRVARLLSAGHGGQILLTATTRELVRDALPPGAELRDLGEHRLKDLIRPEHIFQVVVPDLPVEFPPLKTLDYQPHNLPVQTTTFVGRERELAALQGRLRDPRTRLVTLTGPGGTGKTRLAVQVAAELLDDFRDGVWFVDLAPIGDPALVSGTIAQTLGVKEVPGEALATSLAAFLRDKQILLVLDNFEQVVAAAALVMDLLKAALHVKVLITSRIVLHLYGEQEYPVPPLDLPDLKHLPPLEVLGQYAAVALFIQGALAVKPDFAVTNANAPAVAAICSRLDGLPLAIELAAARVKLFPPQALLARLDQRLKMLTGGARNLPARQQTLRGAIDWSYNLLEPEEQSLLARLAVFVGGCTIEAAEAVGGAAGDIPGDVLDGLVSLVDKSLLRQVEGTDGEPRIMMLETIREYGLERLAATGEAEALRRTHAEYYLTFAEGAAPELDGGPHQIAWFARLDAELDNLRAAIQWALDREEASLALRLGTALREFWMTRAYLSEGRRWLEAALAIGAKSPGTVDAALRASALTTAGWLAANQKDYAPAEALLEQSLALAREIQDTRRIMAALGDLGQAVRMQGDFQRAIALYEESAALGRQIGDKRSVEWALCNLGIIAHADGDDAGAQPLLEEGVAVARDLDDKICLAWCLSFLARLATDRGDFSGSAAIFAETLALFDELGHLDGVAFTLEGIAALAAAQADMPRAARLFGAAEALREAINRSQPPYTRDLVHAGAHMDRAEFQAAWTDGRALSLEQAVAYALAQIG